MKTLMQDETFWTCVAHFSLYTLLLGVYGSSTPTALASTVNSYTLFCFYLFFRLLC